MGGGSRANRLRIREGKRKKTQIPAKRSRRETKATLSMISPVLAREIEALFYEVGRPEGRAGCEVLDSLKAHFSWKTGAKVVGSSLESLLWPGSGCGVCSWGDYTALGNQETKVLRDYPMELLLTNSSGFVRV